jgi:hypothetical protein
VLALCVTIFAIVRIVNEGGLTARIGTPSWRAPDSWSANITVGASFVNALMTAGVSADQMHSMSRTGYSIAVVLFSSLLVLAPVVFGLFRNRGLREQAPVNSLTKRPIVESGEGYVATFLAAGWLTLWASLGQLATFGLLIYELRQTNGLSEPVARLISVIVAGVMAGISGYAGYGMVTTARLASAKPVAVDKSKSVDKAEPERERLDSAPAPRPAADWALL